MKHLACTVLFCLAVIFSNTIFANDVPIQPTVAEVDWTAPLHKAVRGATRLRVRTGGTCHRNPEKEKTLLDLRETDEIAEVIANITIDPNENGFHCMCCGGPTLEFYRGDELLAMLGYHHGLSLRWPNGNWAGDGLLTESARDFLISWLEEHGVSGPKEEYEYGLRIQKQAAVSQKRWLAAMPTSLKPFWESMSGGLASSEEMNETLSKQFPDPQQRILTLLQWYGSGRGPWSGFPAYESFAAELLLFHKTEAILDAIRNAELTEEQIEGVARLFAGWHFSQQRPDDLRLVPDDLKQQLLEHSLRSEDEDKRGRAKWSFDRK